MNNKLSELSKPEQFDAVVEIHGGEPFAVWAPAVNGSHVKAELYFALQHESAVNWEAATSLVAENEELKRDMEAKDKRIAEHEAKLNHYMAVEHARASFDQTADIIKRADDAEREASELRAKLATPVRLPKRWDISGQVNPPRIVQVQFEQQNRTLDQCAESIRAAGFTVGDE